jgi:hypothetical protein
MPAANKSSVKFSEACRPFIDAGISDQFLIPVVPYGATLAKTTDVEERHIGKAPGRYRNDGTWAGLAGKGLLTQGTTEEEVERWASWPTENVGILGLGFPAIDSDAESAVAAKLVEAALVKTFGKDVGAAVRLRGKGHRKLYAFEAFDPKGVRSRRVVFTPEGDTKATGIDIKARGGYYVASGQHPSGDYYGWDGSRNILDRKFKIRQIVDADIDAFLSNLQAAVEAQGGTWDKGARAGGYNDDRKVRDLEPAMSLRDVMHGLNQIPNSQANFPDREDLVSILSAIRAALGSEADAAEDDIREWAVHSAMEPGWCREQEDFQKTWDSLGTVRTGQDALERIFRKHGLFHATAASFPEGDGAEVAAQIKDAKKTVAFARLDLLDEVADALAFRDANTLENLSVPMVRDRLDVGREIRAIDWWKSEMMLSDPALLARIQAEEPYTPTRTGLANFMRDMRAERPEAFFEGTIMDPKAELGDIVIREADGQRRRLLNLRRQSAAILLGRKLAKVKPDNKDLGTILSLMNRMFGDHVGFELDTLAYMAQTGDRPGSMLFLVGDKGVGKSMYIEMLVYLFDGKSSAGRGYVDGTKIANENSRRFAFANIEGCRILSLREIPKGMKPQAVSEMTSAFKTMCDRGLGGDLIGIEGKGINNKFVENVCRVVVSSNHDDAVEIEEGDRRIFFIESGITVSNRFSEDFYKELDTITKDPARLAVFWRFLLDRDIGKYSAYSAPPITKEKLRRAVLGMVPTRRHFVAALALLNASGRECVTNHELRQIMHRMSVLEHENSGGAIDDVFDYTREGQGMNPANVEITHSIRAQPREKFMPMNRDIRAGGDRFKVYVLERGMKRKTLPYLEGMSGRAVRDFLKEDRDENDFVKHPLEEFREP